VSRRADGSGETGSRARAKRRSERRLPHLKALAIAAEETKLLMHVNGAEHVGELVDGSPFEVAARAVIADHERGKLNDADLESLGLREADDGSLWIRVGPPWGRG
jgi:hypothetical protein